MIDLVTYKILKKGDFKMKKVTTLLLFIAISMLLVACSDKEKAAEDIITYYNEAWIPINNFKKDETDRVFPEYNKLDAKEDKTEAKTFVKEEIIPIVEETIAMLEEVEVNDRQSKKMNKLQIKAENTL